MGEVAEIFDVNCSLIRFWEKKFDILKPHKNNKGNRLFTPQDMENLKLIYHLVKENGMTLAGAQKRLKENREGIERNIEIVEKLHHLKTLLLEIKQELVVEDGAREVVVDSVVDTIAETHATLSVDVENIEPISEPEPVSRPLAVEQTLF